jgi:metal-responsive CopG/Arc/MetJ family transcriptional regulator
MFNQTTLLDDTQEAIMIDSNLIAQIDARLGDTFLTREAFIQSALQEYITHIDEMASKQTVHLPKLRKSYT